MNRTCETFFRQKTAELFADFTARVTFLRGQKHIVKRGEGLAKAVFLKDGRKAGRHILTGRQRTEIMNLSVIRRFQPQNQPQQSGFSAPGSTGQTVDIATLQRE
jgi:hypothetical protein